MNSRKEVEVNAQVQFIDFEGRSDGESLLKILSQLRPRRVIVVRGTPKNIELVANHCSQSIGARVFTPNKGDVVDATTETHIYQVKLTEALVGQLQFQRGKEAEVAWIDAQLAMRNKKITPTAHENGTNNATNGNATNSSNNSAPMEVDQDNDDNGDIETHGLREFHLVSIWEHYKLISFSLRPAATDATKVLTLEPINDAEIPPHNSVFINELKISDFKQVLTKNNIQAEFSNGALWCANSTLAIRRVSKSYFVRFVLFEFIQTIHRLTPANCALKDVYRKSIIKYETYYTTNMPSFKVKRGMKKNRKLSWLKI